MKKSLSLFFTVLFSAYLLAQKIDQQIELRVDNDKLVLVDRYYTSGLFISYKKSIENDFLFKKEATNKIQLVFAIGNEIYTPTDLSSFNSDNFDRPFAGWFFGKFELVKIQDKSAKFLTFETGITGKEALSGDLQVWFHEVLGIENFTSWAEEIEFKWLFNFKYRYLHNWSLHKKNSIQYEFYPSVGTKDIFLENNIHYFFGKFNELKNSSRIGAIDATNSKEFYGLISLGHRYVAHNTLIRGSIFKEDILFTTASTNHVFKFRLGTVYKNKRNAFKLIYNFNSRETPRSTSHAYGTFIYSRNF